MISKCPTQLIAIQKEFSFPLIYQNLLHLAQSQPMKKPSLTLETDDLSDNDHRTTLDTFSGQSTLTYPLIYQEVKSFLKQCKESISNYIHFNQFGARFNLFALYTKMNSIETSAFTHLSDDSKVSYQKLGHHQNHKITYEKQFQSIVQRMESVIKDFLKFEVDLKREYFGTNLKQPEAQNDSKKIIKRDKSSLLIKTSRQSSVYSSSSANRRFSRIFKKDDEQRETQLQEKLREILKRKLAPQKENFIKLCDKESDPYKNMLKLEQKIDMMQSEINLNKIKEEEIIEIFNKRRIERIHPKGHEIERIHPKEHEMAHWKLIDENEQKDGEGIKKLGKSRFHDQAKAEEDGKKARKSRVLIKLSLDMDIVNESTNKKSLDQHRKSTPILLISPKGASKVAERKMSYINYLCSPKNMKERKIYWGSEFL